MTIDCDQLLSMSPGYVTPPPPAVNLVISSLNDSHEDVATPKLVAGAGHMDGVMADALHEKLKQLEEQTLRASEEAYITPCSLYGGLTDFGYDFAKVPLPGPEVDTLPPTLLPPPQPHAVKRPAKDPRFRPIPERANVVISKGSVGHPLTCANACKYVKRKGGCRDGADCPNCHECFWSKGSKENEKRMTPPVDGELQAIQMEGLADKFARLLEDPRNPIGPQQAASNTAMENLMAFSQGPYLGVAGAPPGLEMSLLNMQGMMQPEVQLNPGSLGHPYSCGPACKYVLKTRGCKDGDNCNHCHLCRWTRYSAKTLKL